MYKWFTSKLKGRATKSGRKSRDENKVYGKSKDSTSKSGANSEDDCGDKPKDCSQINSTKSGDSSRTLGKSEDVDGWHAEDQKQIQAGYPENCHQRHSEICYQIQE